MSLLLDALKKAAKDKQNASTQSDAADDERAQTNEEPVENELVLTLDEQPEDDDKQTDSADTAESVQEEAAATGLALETGQTRTSTSTVSDEALQMLVYKTNREHRRKQKTVWGAIAAVSVLILLVGGYYFYDNMVKDIESLERKHRIAIQKVNAEVIKQKRPELIADLTDRQVEDDKTPAQNTQTRATAKKVSNAPSKRAVANRAKSKAETPQFVRTTRKDPVSELLQHGWQAYNQADYATASRAYSSVLQREPENRDALLGMAAIAMQQQRTADARAHYAKLLKLNPRDPIAVAALTNIRQAEAVSKSQANTKFGELSESRLKMLLKQQPESAPINFALGNISAQQKKWPQAQAYYFNAWMADDANPDYAFNLAVSLDHIGKTDQAARFYRRSLELATQQNHRFSTDAARQRLQALEQQP